MATEAASNGVGPSNTPERPLQVVKALANNGAMQIFNSYEEESLLTCDEIEQQAVN